MSRLGGHQAEGDPASPRASRQDHSAPLERDAQQDVDALSARLGSDVRSMFSRSLHIRTVDTGSCAACESEVRLLVAPHYDLHRLGLFFTPSPRHADLLLVTGAVTRAMDGALAKTYAAMPDPKVVVAVGACPLGGVYSEDAMVHGDLESVLPVDVFVPGCPPSPLALLHGLLVAVGRLKEKVEASDFCFRAELLEGGVPEGGVPLR